MSSIALSCFPNIRTKPSHNSLCDISYSFPIPSLRKQKCIVLIIFEWNRCAMAYQDYGTVFFSTNISISLWSIPFSSMFFKRSDALNAFMLITYITSAFLKIVCLVNTSMSFLTWPTVLGWKTFSMSGFNPSMSGFFFVPLKPTTYPALSLRIH